MITQKTGEALVSALASLQRGRALRRALERSSVSLIEKAPNAFRYG